MSTVKVRNRDSGVPGENNAREDATACSLIAGSIGGSELLVPKDGSRRTASHRCACTTNHTVWGYLRPWWRLMMRWVSLQLYSLIKQPQSTAKPKIVVSQVAFSSAGRRGKQSKRKYEFDTARWVAENVRCLFTQFYAWESGLYTKMQSDKKDGEKAPRWVLEDDCRGLTKH